MNRTGVAVVAQNGEMTLENVALTRALGPQE